MVELDVVARTLDDDLLTVAGLCGQRGEHSLPQRLSRRRDRMIGRREDAEWIGAESSCGADLVRRHRERVVLGDLAGRLGQEERLRDTALVQLGRLARNQEI